ncbi:hypothetical protein Csa_014060 [Cucumis sativus]|uniref:Uncharacterized protein n=1 Tax=Cucumis sativus TaxID=3659 RepID=A0A0A0LPM9_CUCSA|nr:hypothetical protein Csa_014060 [Cucumis sativus]
MATSPAVHCPSPWPVRKGNKIKKFCRETEELASAEPFLSRGGVNNHCAKLLLQILATAVARCIADYLLQSSNRSKP